MCRDLVQATQDLEVLASGPSCSGLGATIELSWGVFVCVTINKICFQGYEQKALSLQVALLFSEMEHALVVGENPQSVQHGEFLSLKTEKQEILKQSSRLIRK